MCINLQALCPNCNYIYLDVIRQCCFPASKHCVRRQQFNVEYVHCPVCAINRNTVSGPASNFCLRAQAGKEMLAGDLVSPS
ncbi:hypothetical protein BGX38DRAFT_1218101, partial [Terfezia claveryi]